MQRHFVTHALSAFIFLRHVVLDQAAPANVLSGFRSIPLLRPTSGVYDHAAVSADNGVCSDIGKQVLIDGGNAVDAVIATAICIGVHDPHSSGLGGGHFLTIYDKQKKSCAIIDARERAPLAASEQLFQNNTNLSKIGWKAIGVPGELNGFWTAYKLYGGKVPWKDLWTPTIQLCRQGVRISPAVAKVLQEQKRYVENNPYFQDFKNPKSGRLLDVGDTIQFPLLAHTMEAIANSSDPVKLFYDSAWTDLMVKEITDNGGIITREDMANYTSRTGAARPPIYTTLFTKNLTFCSPPPPSAGALTTSILNVMDAMNMSSIDPRNDTAVAQFWHAFLEATKFAYGVRGQLGDLDFVRWAYRDASAANLAAYAGYLAAKIGDTSATDPAFYGAATNRWDHGTAHMSVVDADGNAASLTASINLYFGAKVRSRHTGIIYNNEMDDFSVRTAVNAFEIEPSPENRIEPGKRPQSSMSPIIGFNPVTGQVKMSIGAAGGVKIIAAVAQVVARMLYLGEDIKQATDAPRIYNQLLPFESTYESGFPDNIVQLLVSNHKQLLSAKVNSFFSVVCGINRLNNGSLEANSDYRKGGGYPAGF